MLDDYLRSQDVFRITISSNYMQRFNPNRFIAAEGEGRKHVHWPSNNDPSAPDRPPSSPAKGVLKSSSNPLPLGVKPTRAMAWITLEQFISWVPVVIIVSYLLVRDGWFALLAHHVSTWIAPIGFSARWLRTASTSSHLTSFNVKQQIDEHLYQRMWGPALRDFALAAHGAVVDPDYTSPYTSTYPPSIVLNDHNHIGHCWSIPSSHGQLGIALSDLIFPTNVTIDHIPRELVADPGQTPRRLVLWGMADGRINQERYYHHLELLRANQTLGRDAPLLGDGLFFVLADFSYDIHDYAHIQTFPTLPIIRDIGLYVGSIVLEIVDNWGAETTCIYRVRIHGEKTTAET